MTHEVCVAWIEWIDGNDEDHEPDSHGGFFHD